MPTLTPALARQITAKCIHLEAKIDPILFRKNDDEMSDGAKIGAAAVVGAGAYGGMLAHKSVLRNYGGEGGAVEAYRNLGRNALRSAQEGAAKAGSAVSARVTPVIGAARGAVVSAADRTAKSYTAAREIAGLNPAMAGLRAAKKGANPLISRILATAARFRK